MLAKCIASCAVRIKSEVNIFSLSLIRSRNYRTHNNQRWFDDDDEIRADDRRSIIFLFNSTIIMCEARFIALRKD